MIAKRFSKVLILAVCIILVFAVAAALLFDGSGNANLNGNSVADAGERADEVSGASYPVSADGYTHGSNIGRATSGTNVNSASAFISALNSNSNINITGSFTMSSSYAFSHSGTYSGTIYGNGYTISYSGPHSNNSCTGNYSSDSSIGALVSVLSGKIYDLNVNFTGGQAAFAITSGGGNINVGGIVGYLNGGTIENCTMTFSGSGMRLGAATWSSSYGSWPNSKDSWPAVGAIAGKMAGGSTIKNVTVKSASSSNYIVAGVAAGGSSTSSLSINNTIGTASMLAGYIDGGTSTVDNIVIEGNGTVKGFYGSLLGMSASGSTSISTTNFYNKFEGTLDTTNNGNGASYVKYDNSGSVSVSNMYKSSNAYDSNGTWAGTISNRVTVNTSNYTVGFDPKADSVASSLVIVKTGVTGGEDYSATITSANNTQYANNYAFSSNGSTVIFRNLPTAISNWGGNGGTFNCTINITLNAIEVTPVPDVNKWESSYTTTTSSTGTAVDNGSKLTTAINNNQNIYLTGDITDFNGFSHTGTYSGTLDGNGHTIYIVRGADNSSQTVGGLFGTLTGTIKNVRIVLYSSYNRTISTNKIGTGIVAGNLNGGTVDNVYVYIPGGVTFGANGGSNYESYLGAVAGVSVGNGYSISNTTVDIDGEIRLDGSWIYMSAFVGKSEATATTANFRFTNVTLRGTGSYDSDYSASDEPIFLGASTILFTSDGVSGKATLDLNGFINDFQGTVAAANYSMYGILTQNKKTGNLTGWTINTSNAYDYDTPLADVNKTSTNNKYIEITSRSTVSTTVEGLSTKVTPYFPAGNTDNLVLVAGDGSSECPLVTCEGYEGVKDGNYMVVSVPKSAIEANSTVQLTQGKSPVGDPALATTEEELVYKGGEITVAINQLLSGDTALAAGDYTVAVTANGGNALVQNGNPVNAGDYILTVTLLNGYEFTDGTTEKTIGFTVTPFVISGSLAINGSEVYDKTEKTVIFTADENKGLFNNDSVVISYNDGDRVNVTEAGFTATATVPNANYTFADGNAISADFSITAKELTVVWGNTSFTYDGNEKAPTADVTEGVIDGDDVALSVSGAVAAAGQDYTATATISPENANYTLTNNTILFSIAKAKVSVSGANATVEYKGEAYTEDEIKAAVFTSGLPDGATTTVTVDPASVINAGDSATVTVALIDGDNYEFEAGATTQFTFTVKAKEIALPEGSADKSEVYSPSATYTAAQITELIFGTASIDNVTVKVMKGDVEISGDTAVSDAGTYTVTATANANYVFAAETVTEYTFEITKAPITLEVSVEGWTYGDEANAPAITGNDGNGAVTYLYTGTDYSDAVAPTNAGTYSLEITVVETANYQGGSTSCEFTIAKAVVTVPAIADKVYTGEVLTADITDTEEYEVVENSGGTDVATYDVVIRLKDAANYKWSDGTETAEITLEFNIIASSNSWKKEPSIAGWTYGEYSAATNSPVYEAKEGDETAVVEFRLQSATDEDYATVEDLSTLGAGAYYMRVRVPKTEEYGGLSAVVEFTVSKAAISVTVSIDGWTYGDEAKTPSVSGNTASGEVTFSYEGVGDTAYEASTNAPVNAGTYKLTATVAETDNYLGATAEAEFTIAKKAITATVAASNVPYDGNEHTATVTFDGKVGEDELTATLLYNGEADVPVNAGSYTVTVQSYGGAAVDNYDITTAEGEVKLVISPKQLTYSDFDVLPEDVGFDGVYDGKPHGVVATVKEGVLIGDDTLTVTVLYNDSAEKPVNAGIYEISIAIYGNDNYVMGEDNSAELEIRKATVTVAGNNATATYTGEAFSEDAIIKAVFGEADLSLVNVTVTYREGEEVVDKGDIADIEITLKDSVNYEFTVETVTAYTFTVTAGTVRLDGEDKTVEYKGAAYTEDEIKNAIFGEGTWAGFIIDISYNNGAALNAGDIATVTVTGYNDANYALDPEMKTEYTFSVTTYKVAAPGLTENTLVYNGAEQSVSLVDGTYVELSANVQTDKGDYTAVAALKDKTNYEWATGGIADVELSWSITAKEITLKAETSVDKVYDGEAYDFGGYVVAGADGFFGRDNVTVTVSAGEIYTPGTYAIIVTHDANANYVVTVETTDAKLIINKATLTISATIAEIEYTGDTITFEFNITGGKVGEDDVQIDGITYRQSGVAVSPIEAGTYDVEFTLKGAQAGYYNAGTAQVKITPQTATAPDGMTADSIVIPEGALVYNGNAYVAELDYESTDGNVYGIVYHNGVSYVDEAVNAGEYTIHVYKNTKTNIVEDISKTMIIEKKELAASDVTVSGLSFTYSGGANNVTATGRGVNGEYVELVSLYDGEETAPVNAGTYTVTFRSADGNYTVADNVSYEMSVARASVVTPVAKALTYNGEEQIAFDEDARYTLGGVYSATNVSADGYTATFTLVSSNYKWAALDNENILEISVTWNISPEEVEISASGATATKVYDGVALTEEELKALFNAPDKIGGGKVEIAVSVNNGGEVLNAGIYTVTAEINDINYTAEAAEVTYTVTQATPVAEPEVDDIILQEGYKLGNVGIYVKEGGTAGVIVWDEPETLLVKGDNEVSWTFTPEDTANYTTLSGTVTLTVGDDVLDRLEIVSGPEKTDYVAFEEFDGTGMVLKAVFNGGLKEQTFGVDKCRVVIENDVDGKMSAATTKVIIYYGEEFVEIEVSVSKITVTEPVLEVTELEYNAQMQTLPFEVGADEKYYVKGGNTATNVGSYNLEIELKDKVNYEWSSGTSDNLYFGWKITPVSLSVEISVPEDLVYDGNGKEATFELVQGTLYGGAQLTIVYEQNGNVINGLPVNAGEYDVVVKLPDSNNYRFASKNTADMTIAKKVVTIKTNGDREKYYDGKEVTLEELAGNFTVSDGLKVKVTVSGTVLNAGSYKVTAVLDTANSNYTSNEVSYIYTVRKADKTVNATMSVDYKSVTISVEGGNEGVEYSLNGFDWQPLDGAIQVELAAQYKVYVRYAESENYNTSATLELNANITKDALMAYIEERFVGEITLADAKDVAYLETLAEAATGDNAEFDAKLAELYSEREELVNGATDAVEKALKAGGALKGYAAAVVAVAATLGGISLIGAAVGLCVKTRKGGRKNEEK